MKTDNNNFPGGQWRMICLLLLLAAIPRVVAWSVFDFIDSGGGSDPVAYLNLARNLFSGEGYSTFGEVHTVHHPLYPVFIGIFWRLLGDLLRAGQAVSVLAGVALVIPVYGLARNLFGVRAAVYAGLLTAFCPVLVYGSTEVFCESLYVFFLISALAVFAAAWRNGRTRPMGGAGILTGLAFLTHPAGVTFLPVMPLFLLIGQALPGRTAWRTLLARSGLLLAGFCLAVLPWWLYLRSATGHWQMSGSSHYRDISLMTDLIEGRPESEMIFEHMELIYNPDLDPDADREAVGMFELLFRNPEAQLQLIAFNLAFGAGELEKTARFLGIGFGLLAALLALLVIILAAGVVFFLKTTRRYAETLLLALCFLPALTFILVIMQHRYFYPFFPLAWILLGAVLAAGVERSSRIRRGLFFRWATVGICLIFLAATAGVIRRKWRKDAIPYEYKLLGEWMRENIPGLREEKVMAFRLGFSFYADSSWNVFFWGDYPGLLEYMRDRGLRYLIIDDYKLYMIHPELQFLIEDPPPENWERIRTEKFRGRRATLLRLRDSGD